MRIALLTTDNREQTKEYDKPTPFFGTAPEALLQGFAVTPEVEVHVVSCVRRPVVSPPKLADNIYYHSLLVPKVGWMTTFYQGCIRATRRKLRALKPDIVHGQGTERDCAMSAVFSGYPNVLTIHGNMAQLARLFRARVGSYGWLAARLENLALRRTAGVFCNSAHTERLVGARARRTWRVPNPLRPPFFSTPLPAGRSGRPVLLNVGVLGPNKRQLELLELGRRLQAQRLSFELLFIGAANPANPYAREFLDRIRVAEQAGYARSLGVKPVEELVRCMDAAAALVHFPLEEAFGLVVAEALARNLKFFGARVGGIIDITQGVPGAELFALEDWEGLGRAIAVWIQQGCPQPETPAGMMQQQYHPSVIARRHVEIYRGVLRGH